MSGSGLALTPIDPNCGKGTGKRPFATEGSVEELTELPGYQTVTARALSSKHQARSFRLLSLRWGSFD